MTEDLKHFVEQQINRIENNEFEFLYKFLMRQGALLTDSDLISEFTRLMLDIDIDPALYMSEIPQDYLFNDSKIKHYSIPENITRIGQNAFKSCMSLQSVSIPSSVTILDSSVIETCPCLETLFIPDSVVEIAVAAINDCVNLKKIHLPLRVKDPNVGFGLPSLNEFTYSGTCQEFKKSRWCKLKRWREDFKSVLVSCSDGTIQFKDID